MFRWFVNWCIGRRDYRVSPEKSSAAASLLVRYGIQTELKSIDGRLCFSLPVPVGRSFEKKLTACGIEYEMHERSAARLISRYRKRPGILIGALLFCAMILLSRNFVWDIRVEGNDDVSADEIISELSELGFREGTYIKSVDFDKLHSDFLQSDRRFAWIAVNMFGTHATVEVREALRPEPVPDEDTPYNIVAAEDGVIESIDLYRGTRQVRKGDMVRKGELLASGVIETKQGFALVHARGEILASVERDIRVEVPLEREEKVFTGREFRESSIKILGFSLKIFKSTGNPPSNCDIIYSERKLSVFGVIELPMTLCEKVAREYETEMKTISPEEAKAEAFEKFRKECEEFGGELTGREINAGMSDRAYIIDGKLKVIKDIGVEIEILR